VTRRVLPAALVVLAAYADARGAHGLAFDALLAAIPFAAVASLVGFGSYIEKRDDAVTGLQALLSACAVAFLVLSCAARSPATQAHSLPPLGRSALLGCLAVLFLQGIVAVVPFMRRLALAHFAKP
jgi:hypothetical protein